ncbi:MAG TPA: zf-TFIIB domain-containing protein [Rhodanobacteraceae bacterium]
MKCPKCKVELVQTVRHKVDMQTCPSCKGMWLDARELDQLENETFDLGEDEKGMLVYDAMSTTQPCPVCAADLKRFNYHAYALQMDVCPNQHGFWLDAGADDEVLKLMRDEERGYKRSASADAQWSRTLQHMRSGSFLEKLKDLFH